MTRIQQMKIDDQVRSTELSAHPDLEEILMTNATGEEIQKILSEIEEIV